MTLGNLQKLWEARFCRILEMEKESLDFYRNLLEAYAPTLEGLKSKEALEKIAADEAMHVRIAGELLRIIMGIPNTRF